MTRIAGTSTVERRKRLHPQTVRMMLALTLDFGCRRISTLHNRTYYILYHDQYLLNCPGPSIRKHTQGYSAAANLMVRPILTGRPCDRSPTSFDHSDRDQGKKRSCEETRFLLCK